MKFSLRAARAHSRRGEFGPAMANYLAILKLLPANVASLETEFLECFEKFAHRLESSKELEQLNEYFAVVGELYPTSPRLLTRWGEFLARQSMYEEAALCFMKSLDCQPNYDDARRCLRTLRHGLVDQWHFRMLNDHQRNSAYEQALSVCLANASFAPPVVVLDVGCGTGILSMLALEVGAQRVYACETSTIMCQLAKKIFADNGYTSTEELTLLEKHSKDLDLDDLNGVHARVIVTELMDAGFFGEDIVGAVLDARKRLLAPDGLVIPSRAKIWASLVECESIRRASTVVANDLAGKPRVRSSLSLPTNSAESTRPKRLEPYTAVMVNKIKGGSRYLSQPFVLDEIDLNDDEDLSKHSSGFCRRVDATITSAGFVDAIISWFDVDLLPPCMATTRVSISTSPENARTSWEQAIFPVSSSSKYGRGDLVRLNVEICGNWMQCSVAPSTTPSKEDAPVCDSLSLIESINDDSLVNFYRSFLMPRTASVLDLTGNPRSTYLASTCGKVTSVYSCPNAMKIAKSFVENEETLMFESTDELDARIGERGENFDVLLVCPVEACGLLKQDALEDVAFCRLRFGVSKVAPSVVEVFGFLVESEELERYARVVADENTLGLKIRDVINIFETDIQRDIELSTLEYKRLSSPTKLMTLNLAESLPASDEKRLPGFLSQSSRTSLETVADGTVHALVFWYEFSSTIDDANEIRLSTADAKTHFRVAASIVNPFVVSNDDLVTVTTTLERSELHFSILLVNLTEI